MSLDIHFNRAMGMPRPKICRSSATGIFDARHSSHIYESHAVSITSTYAIKKVGALRQPFLSRAYL